MPILNCRPISQDGKGNYDNIIVSDSHGYPFAILFADLFHDSNDMQVYEKIKTGVDFQIKVSLVED